MKKSQLLLLLLLALPIGMLAQGSTWESAAQLPLEQEKSGSLSKNRTEDWWYFTVTQDGAATISVTPGSGLRISDVRLYYYEYNNDTKAVVNYWQRSDNAYWMEPGWGAGGFTTQNLAPGNYMLRVQRGEGEGSYSIKCNFAANAYSNNTEVDDWNKANTIALNTSKQGHLGYGYVRSSEDNLDWWAFEVKQDGAATIKISHENTLRISDVRLYYYEYDNDTKALINYWQRTDNAYWMNPGWGAGEFTTPNLAPGTYLVRIERGEGQGGYELTCNFDAQAFANDSEPNTDWDKGLANNYLARGHERQGHLGYGYVRSSEDNYDFYCITVPRDGQVTLTYTPSAVNSALRLSDLRFYYLEYDGDGKVVNYWQRSANNYWMEPGWGAGTLTIPDVKPGEYLVRLERGEGYGAYTLKYEFTQNELPNDMEPDDWNNAMTLPEGKTLSGHLGYGYANGSEDSYDWYDVNLANSGALTVNILPGSGLRISDVRLYYYEYDINGAKVNYWQRTKSNYWMNPGWGPGSFTAEGVDDGHYLIRVERGEGCGYYRISVNADITDVTPQDPLPEEGQEPQEVEVDGTKFAVDEGNKTVTVIESKPDGNGDIHICRFPGVGDIKVYVDPKLFEDFRGGQVKIDYADPPTINGEIPVATVKDKTLVVPDGSKEKYEKDPQWGKFGTIKEEGSVNPGPNPGGETGTCLIVWLSETEKHYYLLSERPKVTMSKGDFTVTTASTTYTYGFADVLKFTLGEKDGTAIEGLSAEAGPSVERQYDRVVFTGCKPESAIYIYNVGGQLLDTQRTDSSGRAEVSIVGLAAGVYVVKSDSVTIKIAKR